MYQQICDWQNLCSAFRRASRGKRGHPNVAAFEHRLEENLLSIQHRLLTRTYRPGGYVSFIIHEPKRRRISAAAFRERVVHHALCNIIEPVFERRFIFDSYANRKGKGNHRALQRCQEFARRHDFVLQCDIRQFFPSVDHAILLGYLSRVVRDQDTLWLIRQTIGAKGRIASVKAIG